MDSLDTHPLAPKIHQLLLEEAITGYWVQNFKDNSGYVSPAFKKMLGYEADEFPELLDKWEENIYFEDIEKLRKNVDAHIASKGVIPHRVEIRYKRKDGSLIWGLAVGRVIEWDENDQPILMVGCHIDINKQKEIEEELKISERQFKGAFEYSSIGMALVSLEGRWLKVNKHLCDLLGYSRNELLSCTFQQITHPEDLDLDLGYLNQVLRGELDHYQIEKRYFHKNGGIIWAQLNVSIIKDNIGNPLHFVSQIQDITQRKRTEANLIALTEKLTARNKKLGDFAHIASHNLRAPVSNLTTLVNMYNQVDDEEDRVEVYNKFKRVVEHLSSTLNDLIDSLKIQENVSLKRENIMFQDILSKTNELLIGQIAETKTVIKADFSAEPEIHYHRPYLESIFLNLISNAIKYHSPERTPEIKITTGKSGNNIFLKVEDNGLGINLRRHGHKVFGLHKTFHRHAEAKGVGLFMTRTQIEAMGGTISVESTEGEGTCFTILF